MTIKRFFLMLLLAASIVTFGAEKLYCGNCRKRITGNYINFGNIKICSEQCLQAVLPKCSVCNQPMRSGFIANGRRFCSEKCFETTLPHCSVCNKVCRDSFTTFMNKIVCSDTCLNSLRPRCMICNSLLNGYHAVFLPNGDLFFCDRCGELPRCSGCSRPTKDYTTLPDGRKLCNDKRCRNSLVMDAKLAGSIFDSVRKRLVKQFGFKGDHPIPVYLVDLDGLRQVEPDMPEGVCGMIHNTYDENHNLVDSSIYIVMGYSRDDVADTCAHELAHDDMLRRFPFIDDLKIIEGYAEYVAYNYNQHYRKFYLNRRKLYNMDPIYGDGFREVQAFASRYGEKAMNKFFEKRNQRVGKQVLKELLAEQQNSGNEAASAPGTEEQSASDAAPEITDAAVPVDDSDE